MTDDQQRRLALSRYDVLHNGPEDEFEQIVTLAQMLFSTPMAAITLLDGPQHRIKSHRGFRVDQATPDVVFAAETLRSRGAMCVEDARHDPRFRDHPLVSGPPGFRSYAGAVLRTPEGTCIGTISVIDTLARDFSALDGEIMEQLAKITVASLELRLISSKDKVTGAESRRAFLDAAGRELERHRRRGTPSALLVCRIDGGQPPGAEVGAGPVDEVLATFAARLRKGMRKTDTLGRVGHARFAVLLADAGEDEAETAVARLLKKVKPAETEGVTAALGYAVASARFASAADWMAAADRAARSDEVDGGIRDRLDATHLGVGDRWMN